jgi:hypothetical protein
VSNDDYEHRRSKSGLHASASVHHDTAGRAWINQPSREAPVQSAGTARVPPASLVGPLSSAQLTVLRLEIHADRGAESDAPSSWWAVSDRRPGQDPEMSTLRAVSAQERLPWRAAGDPGVQSTARVASVQGHLAGVGGTVPAVPPDSSVVPVR